IDAGGKLLAFRFAAETAVRVTSHVDVVPEPAAWVLVIPAEVDILISAAPAAMVAKFVPPALNEYVAPVAVVRGVQKELCRFTIVFAGVVELSLMLTVLVDVELV